MRVLILALTFLLLAAVPGQADLRIVASPGGRIGDYLNLYAMVRETGQRVIIDGPCLSACTLVLSVVPSRKICVTRRAILGFHAAWTPDKRGRPVTAAEATRIMYETYPRPVRNWIRKKGGLTRKSLLLHGRELNAMYPRCA